MDYKSRVKNLIEQEIGYQSALFAVLILLMVFFIGLGLGLLIKPGKPTPIIIDKNVKKGSDDTLYAISSGTVKFTTKKLKCFDGNRKIVKVINVVGIAK